MANPTPTLNCGQCGYVNEAERVYCHNCGTKLDRSVLPKEREDKPETLGETRRRVKKMTTQPGNFGRQIGKLVRVVLWGAVTAAVVLIWLEPDNLPPRKLEESQRMVGSDLLEAMNSARPRQLVFSGNDVNVHLKTLKGKASGWFPGLEFQRAFAQFEPDVAQLGFEQSLFGLPLYWTAYYHLAVVDDKLRAHQTGGRFGRLAIDPMLMEYAQAAFQPVWAALKKERAQMDRMQSVSVQKDRIVLITKPAGQP